MAADQVAEELEHLKVKDSTEETRVDAADQTGHDSVAQKGDASVKQEGNDSANQEGGDSVDPKGGDSVDQRGDDSVKQEVNDSANQKGGDSVDTKGGDSVDQKGDDSVKQEGDDSVNQTGRDSTDHGETGAVAVGEAAAPGFSQDTGPNDQSQNRNIPPTPSDQSRQGTRGFVKCGNQFCETCKIALPGDTFLDYDGKKHNIDGTFYCTSESVVFGICCITCRKQYVGKSVAPVHETIERYTRMNKLLVYKHFNEGSCRVSARRCFVIEKVSDAVALKERTKYWKETLNTYDPNGLNKKK